MREEKVLLKVNKNDVLSSVLLYLSSQTSEMNDGHQSSNDYTTTKASPASVTDNGLPRRRFVVSAINNGGEVKHVQNSNDKKLHTTTTSLQQRRRINQYKSRWTLLLISTTILLLLIIIQVKHTLIDEDHLSTASFLRCSSFFLRRSSSKALQPQPTKQTRIILTASHIRYGSDGELRLRIIEHNLRQLISSSTTNVDKQQPNTIIINKSILIFSLDDQYKVEIQTMVTQWKSKLHSTIIPQSILYVVNNAILVDASKWMYALTTTNLLSDIQSTTNNEVVKVMLLNDSFILTRSPNELWNVNCGEVCGLAWSSTSDDPSRHIQSYIRTLTPCAIERYMNFYYETQNKVNNVHELIVLFEINLDWAKRRGRRGIDSSKEGREGDVSAIYDYVGSHPDEDDAQKILIPKGYPAIKLKKFFTTSDPWLTESPTTRTRLPPSFSTTIYKSMNHDLNHLSDVDLEKHFVENGYKEDRIYGSNTLVIKHWLLDELMKMHNTNDQMDTIDILTDYLLALNGNIAKLRSV